MDSPKRPRALIADDEPALAADLAVRLSRLWPELEIAAVVHQGPAAVDGLTRLQPEIAFLDIRMPGLTGLEVATKVSVPHLVFVTAHDEYAISAFDAAAADYLLKPVTDERLEETVRRLQSRLSSGASATDAEALLRRLLSPIPPRLEFVRASVGSETHLVEVASVLYFRADERYTAVQTVNREYLIRTPLKDLLKQLSPEHFWQIHRNTIVNLRAVQSARRDFAGRLTLQLRGRTESLPVSRAFAHRFQQM
jgi:DNA-binding LytR/AlgR family response regulator